jgi:general secretion pathway protein K
MRRLRDHERGAALLVVMVSVAVLTALAVELAYDTRVSLRIAANARDDLKASYAARGGVALSRLVLSFQQEVDAAIPKLGQVSPPRPQLWRVVPVTSALADGLFGGAGALAAEGDGPGAASADGFEVVIDDEGRKVNVQLEALGTNPLLAAQVQALYQLICDPRWDALFDRDDAHGVRVSRQELLVHLRDWVDTDEEGSALAATFPPGACVMLTPQNPFERGYQDENYPYDRGPDRYRAKNARMDSLAELHLVAGIGDAFMAAFGDAITVYLPRDAKRNVNETDPARLLDLAKIVADPPSQPALYDPEFATRLHTFVMERTFGGMLSMSPADFGQLVQAAGVTVNASQLAEGSTQNPFTDRSSVFRVRSLGRAGDVTKTLDVVVQFPTTGGAAGAAQAALVTTPGKLAHWREE